MKVKIERTLCIFWLPAVKYGISIYFLISKFWWIRDPFFHKNPFVLLISHFSGGKNEHLIKDKASKGGTCTLMGSN
jgi:hypothetical protein